MTRSLSVVILFSTVVKAEIVAKLIILGSLFLISYFLKLRVALVSKLVISDILLQYFWSHHYICIFLTTSSFTSGYVTYKLWVVSYELRVVILRK